MGCSWTWCQVRHIRCMSYHDIKHVYLLLVVCYVLLTSHINSKPIIPVIIVITIFSSSSLLLSLSSTNCHHHYHHPQNHIIINIITNIIIIFIIINNIIIIIVIIINNIIILTPNEWFRILQQQLTLILCYYVHSISIMHLLEKSKWCHYSSLHVSMNTRHQNIFYCKWSLKLLRLVAKKLMFVYFKVDHQRKPQTLTL